MEQAQNPTAQSPGGASTPSDPLDRLEAYLAAEDGGDTTQDEGNDEPAKPAATQAKPGSDPQGEDKEPQFTTTHLAQYLGLDESAIDVDEEGQPIFKSKIDGKESPVKFQDLLKSYQLQGHAENRAREAAEKEKAAERRMQEAEQQVQARLQQQQDYLQNLHNMAGILQQELNGEYQAIDWRSLWQQDPAQAREYERRFEQRQARINQTVQGITQRDAQLRHEASRQSEAAKQQRLQAQAKRLLDLIPDWKDSAVYEKERNELLQWARASGVDPSDLDLDNAAQVYLLRNSWQHAKLQQSKPEIENKVRQAPKLVKPGAKPADTGGENPAHIKALKQQARSTGGNSTKAVADYFMARGLA